MAPKVNASHFETLYEVLWNYSVTLRILSKQHGDTTLSGGIAAMNKNSRSHFREIFYAELLSTLIVMFERRERRGRKDPSANMLAGWQDDGTLKILSRELFVLARKNGQTRGKDKKQMVDEIRAELNAIFELAAGDMYRMVCDGPESITTLLEGLVKVARMNLPQQDDALCAKLIKLRNKINFLIAIVRNYGDQEEQVARQQLKKDMLSGFESSSGGFSVEEMDDALTRPLAFTKEKNKKNKSKNKHRKSSSSSTASTCSTSTRASTASMASMTSNASSGSASSMISIMEMDAVFC